MSLGAGQRVPPLRFSSPPRRRRFPWLILALILAAAALIAGARGLPAPEPEPGATDDPADHGAPDAADADVQRTSDAPADAGGASGDTEADADPVVDGSDEDDVRLPPLLGHVDQLEVRVPAERAVVVGFHEASSASFAIAPIGRLTDNHNPTRFEGLADRDDGVDYLILSSRGRVHPPTSAVDVVLVDDEPVLAPVSGVVADVREYHLYGTHLDHRVEIHPDGAPHLRVVLVHLDDLHVREGERVEAGVTILAGTANRFPFSSQIDRETEPDRWPHVHLEVQRIDAPRPGDEIEDEEDDEA